jgi:hypothetical protein
LSVPTELAASRPFPLPAAIRKPAREARLDAALRASLKAERKAHGGAGAVAPRRRIAFLLCELGSRLGPEGGFALGRRELSEALGIGLCKVKRVLALFALSRDIAPDTHRIRVLDWRRLCAAAGYAPAGLVAEEDEEEDFSAVGHEEEAPRLTTASGEPAFFG